MRWRMHGLGAWGSARTRALLGASCVLLGLASATLGVMGILPGAATRTLTLVAQAPGGTGNTAAASASPVAAAPPLELEYAGCTRVSAERGCEVDAGAPLTLWMRDSFHGVRLLVNGREVPGEERVVAGGYQRQLVPPGGPGELQLEKMGSIRFRLPLAENVSDPRLAQAESAKNAGNYPRALELADGLEQSADARVRLRAQGVRARVYLRLGRVDEASDLLAHTSEELFARGERSDAARDIFARLFILLQRQFRTREAQGWLARWRDAASAYPLGRALVQEHEGLLAASAGQLSAALHAYARAERSYERLGLASELWNVQETRIGLLAELGQTQEAYTLQAARLPPAPEQPACGKANAYSLHSWLTLLLVAEGRTELAATLPSLFEETKRWLEPCADPQFVATDLVNRGLWALSAAPQARTPQLHAELAQLPPERGPYLDAWVHEVKARFALERGELELAREHFARQVLIGESAGHLDPKLRGWIGLGELASLHGHNAEAARYLESAFAALEQGQRFAPFGALAHTHFDARKRAALRLVDAWLALGNTAAAYRTALSAYGAALGAQAQSARAAELAPELQARFADLIGDYQRRRGQMERAAANDWQLTTGGLEVARAERRAELAELEQLLERAASLISPERSERALPAPAPGELWLLSTQTERGWQLFAAQATGVEGARFAGADVDAILHDGGALEEDVFPLLKPFARSLAHAERIVILAGGASRFWPFERWRLAGEPLAQRPVAFGAGLASTGTAPDAGESDVRIIADPTLNLPFARREGSMILEALRLPRSQLLLGEDASVSNALTAFAQADLLHFAGHARAPEAASEPALLLARQGELEAWEFFGLGRVPRHVVLSACDSGRTRAEAGGAGWGLAQVLLAAGAASVVAPVAPLGDGDAFTFQERFYTALAGGAPFESAFWQARRSADPSAPVLRLFVR